MTDESEVGSIPSAVPANVDLDTGEIRRPTLAERVAEKAQAVTQDAPQPPEPQAVSEPMSAVAARQRPAEEPPVVPAPAAPAPTPAWDYARFRKLFEGARNPPSLAKVAGTAAEMFPGRDIELFEPKAWELTSEEWRALAERLAS
ncbi:MAG: hypothetical protein H0W36_07785 [Gemmatimonadetes bacterium]|nr:hypothetical protein [Gemmatimonadota bacterium]